MKTLHSTAYTHTRTRRHQHKTQSETNDTVYFDIPEISERHVGGVVKLWVHIPFFLVLLKWNFYLIFFFLSRLLSFCCHQFTVCGRLFSNRKCNYVFETRNNAFRELNVICEQANESTAKDECAWIRLCARVSLRLCVCVFVHVHYLLYFFCKNRFRHHHHHYKLYELTRHPAAGLYSNGYIQYEYSIHTNTYLMDWNTPIILG